ALAGEPGVVERNASPLRRFIVPPSGKELGTSGRIGFARLLHAPANQALEVFVGGHLAGPFGRATGDTPPSDDARGVQRIRQRRSGSLPPFASRGPRLGQGLRGWARTGRPPYSVTSRRLRQE